MNCPRQIPALAYVGLGSNLDVPEHQLDAALRRLSHLPGTTLLRTSRFYRTKPWGRVDQPDFVNAVAELSTTLAPLELLDALIGIEQVQGRERITHWGPRTLDLDLLLYDSLALQAPRLQLPHPHLHKRAFVLAPLAELVPELRIGEHGTVMELRDAVGCDGVELLAEPPHKEPKP